MSLRLWLPIVALVVALAAGCGSDGDGEAAEPTWFFDQTAEQAVREGDELVLRGVQPSLLAVSDRPERIVTRMPTESFVDAWSDRFGEDPPNAILTGADGDVERSFALELDAPTYSADAQELRFEAGVDGSASFDEPLARASLVIDSARQLDFVVRVTPGGDGSEAAGTTVDLGEIVNRRIDAIRGPGALVELEVASEELDGAFEFRNDSGEPLRVRISEGTDTFLDEVVRNERQLTARPPS